MRKPLSYSPLKDVETETQMLSDHLRDIQPTIGNVRTRTQVPALAMCSMIRLNCFSLCTAVREVGFHLDFPVFTIFEVARGLAGERAGDPA